MRNWCLPRKVINNMILFLTGFMDGLIFSKIARSTGLYFRMGLRSRKTKMAMAAVNNESESKVSATINVVISQKSMDADGMQKQMQRVCKVNSGMAINAAR